MEKLPVFRTIGRAYAFAFGSLATTIGLIWLPLLVLAIGTYFCTIGILDVIRRLASTKISQAVIDDIGRSDFVVYYFFFAALFLLAVMAAPVMQQALGLRKGGAFVHFGLRGVEFRTFLAMFLRYLVLTTLNLVSVYAIILLLAAGILATTAVTFFVKVPQPWQSGVISAMMILVYLGAYLYFSVRLSFFVVPLAVAEKKIALVRAWRLAGGRFWRIFWILFAIRLPLFVVGGIFALTILSVVSADFTAIATGSGHPSNAMASVLPLLRKFVPFVFGIAVFLEPLRLGLESGAAAEAYLAVVPSLPVAPDKPEAVLPTAADGVPELAPAVAAS